MNARLRSLGERRDPAVHVTYAPAFAAADARLLVGLEILAQHRIGHGVWCAA